MDVLKFLNSVGGIIGAVGIVIAAVFGALYGGKKAEKDKDNNTIDTYEKNADATSKLLATRERELTELELKYQAERKRVVDLEVTVRVLNEKFTQAPSISDLTLKIGDQHNEMMKQISAMTKELGNIAKALPKAAVFKDRKE